MYFVKNITSLLEEYVNFPNATYAGPGELEEQYIWAAILLLLTEDVFTKEELKAEALKEKRIIIPDYYFDRDLYADKYGK